MEETQSHRQSHSVWGSTQNLASWDINDDKVRDQPSTTQEEHVNDLKVVGTTVTKRTISNTCEGLKSCCACKVPLLKKVHVQARLKFAKEHLDDPEEAWEKVMWSDETKIELFGINSTRRVWMKRNVEYNPKNTIPTVKHGGRNLMLWGLRWWGGEIGRGCRRGSEHTAPGCQIISGRIIR